MRSALWGPDQLSSVQAGRPDLNKTAFGYRATFSTFPFGPALVIQPFAAAPQVLFRAGEAVTGSGSPTTDFSYPALNGKGDLASEVALADASRGVLLFHNGAAQLIAHQGDTAPGGGMFSTLIGDPSLNDSARVVFADRDLGVFLSTKP